MKNKQIVEELKKLNPEESAKVTIICGKRCLDEINYVSGTWEEKTYTCEASTNWRTGELYTEEMTVEDIIKLLKKKEIFNMDVNDFSGLQMGGATDGSTDVYDIEWSEPLTEEEEEIAPSGMDMYWDGDINDVDYEIAPNGIVELTIEVGDYTTTIN
jgi:hypothetical protein